MGRTLRRGTTIAAAVAAFALVGSIVRPVAAADGPDVVDDAHALDAASLRSIQSVTEAYRQVTGGQFLVVTRLAEEPEPAVAQAEADRRRSAEAGPAIVIVVDTTAGGCPGAAGIATTPGAADGDVSVAEAAFVADDLGTYLERCELGSGVAIAAARLISFAFTDAAIPSAAPGPSDGGGGATDPGAPVDAPPPGPPFPNPVVDRAVYDYAGVFSPVTVTSAEATIDAIEARTGAEVVVYSQVVDYGITTQEADIHAQALMDQWGVGRKGFDDGLVVLFDLDPSLVHGQVQLYGGPGYRAAYLDNGEKQKIFDEEMVPRLRAGDLDGALLVALERVDTNATPEHAATLQRARQIDAAVGLIGAPIVLFVFIGSGVFAWLRYGRDPVYLDDPSIHMAGPPPDLTPAAAVFVLSGGSSRRALTTAMLDLASRGLIAFREEKSLLGLNKKVGILLEPPAPDPATLARQARNAARPLGTAEQLAQRELGRLSADDNYIEPDELLKFGAHVSDFDKALESHVVGRGWFREPPSKATGRWALRGAIAIVLGIVAFIGGTNLPSAGLTLLAVALVVSGIALLVMSRWMQAVSIPGAMIRAMLAAYRRTLQKTMALARSMDQVVAEAGLDWLETPDRAVVWGTALGLEKEIEDVLGRSLDDVKGGRAAVGSTYLPVWYASSAGGSALGAAGGGGGLLSSSAVPDFGGMMSALGTIGNSPSSSGSGGGGGGSGGGGGGSGGGF
jgi:uncharacterized membrane protein YgcG